MFQPRYVKHSKLLLRHAQKYLRYKRDVLSEADHADITAGITSLGTALRERDGDRIIGHPSTQPPPNIARQVAEFFILGRNYINVVSKEDDRVEQVVPQKFCFFFMFSRVICQKQKFLVYAPPETLKQ